MAVVAIYARVSTADKDQNLETQLGPLRTFCVEQGMDVYGEYTDSASATNLARRTAWHRLLTDASHHKFDLVLVWRIDRAFRSVLDAAQTLDRLRGWGVGLRSYQEPWLDTTSPFGEALYYITAAYAQLERGILRERVLAGMERVRREGGHLGRPAVTKEAILASGDWPEVEARILSGGLSRRQAAKELGVSEGTIRRLLGASKG